MSDFYQSTPEQQVARIESLAQKALHEWGIGTAELELLKYRENAVYAVITDNSERYAIRVHRHNYHSDAELESELAWMKALGDTVMLIDFDDSGFGWHLFELATSLFFLMKDDLFDEMSAATVQGYREHRELPDEHLEILPVFFLARGLTYLGWAHTRSETETAQAMTAIILEGVCEIAEQVLME